MKERNSSIFAFFERPRFDRRFCHTLLVLRVYIRMLSLYRYVANRVSLL
jgi:hypothetical protein